MPLAAAVYYEDAAVDREFSLETARHIKVCEVAVFFFAVFCSSFLGVSPAFQGGGGGVCLLCLLYT